MGLVTPILSILKHKYDGFSQGMPWVWAETAHSLIKVPGISRVGLFEAILQIVILQIVHPSLAGVWAATPRLVLLVHSLLKASSRLWDSPGIAWALESF